MKTDYKKLIREIQDFPIKGVLFRDVSPLLERGEVFKNIAVDLCEKLDLLKIDAFVGIEARGFIFAAQLAAATGKGFIPLRKAGKLPPPTVKETYKLEYGEATLEMSPASQSGLKVVICDDVLATGGTLTAAISLCEKSGYHIEDIIVLVNLTFLNQFNYKNKEIKSLIQY